MYFVDLLFLLFFCEAHILDVGGKGVPQLFLATPFKIAITVLFLVTQVRFWSLAPLQKKRKKKKSLKRRDRRKDLTTRSAGFWGVIFLPLEGEKAFFTGTCKVPQLYGGTNFGQVPLKHRMLREPELLKLWRSEIYCQSLWVCLAFQKNIGCCK